MNPRWHLSVAVAIGTLRANPLHAAVAALAADVATVYDTIPGVFGPEADARAFGREWCALRGVRAVPGMRQRIYQVERVAEDLPAVPGALRTATRADRDLVIAWFDAFQQEAGVPGGDFVARVEHSIPTSPTPHPTRSTSASATAPYAMSWMYCSPR